MRWRKKNGKAPLNLVASLAKTAAKKENNKVKTN
jgi:hypothetical protein